MSEYDYQTKPTFVRAIQFTGENVEEVKAFLDDKPHYFDFNDKWNSMESPEYALLIRDAMGFSGWQGVDTNWWIVEPWANFYQVIDPDSFAYTYEPVPVVPEEPEE